MKSVFCSFARLMMIAFFAVVSARGETPDYDELVEKYEETLEELEEIKNFPADPETAKRTIQTLLSLNDDTETTLSNLILEAACAGLIALGDNARYVETRNSLLKVADFEKDVLDVCEACDGSGRADCPSCHGSGNCPIQSCRGGRRNARFIGEVECSTCQGTGKCPDCKSSGKSQVRCPQCKGRPKSINLEKAKNVFEKRIAKATRECKSRLTSARNKAFEIQQRERGLVRIQGKWAPPGSRFNIILSVLQKLPIRGITKSRPPEYDEHGGLLCVDSAGEVGCIIVTGAEWHNTQENKSYKFNIYRCGVFSYTTVEQTEKVVKLYATDLETALEELDSGKYSEEFK